MPVNSEQDCCWFGREVGMLAIQLFAPFGVTLEARPGSAGWDIEGHHRQDHFAIVVAGISKNIS
jgi:hypothetical protein